MTPADVLALSDERDMWLRRLLAAERAGYERGLQAGREQGAATAYAQDWARWAHHPVALSGISYRELELRRYGRRKRENFAKPRPGDYQGGPVPAW